MTDDHGCDELLGELSDFLHGEVTPEKQKHLREHLDECPPCLETADFQAQLRQIVAKRCFEEVPTDLQARVVAMLRVEFSDDAGAS